MMTALTPAPLSEQATLAHSILCDMLREMDFPAEVAVSETDEEILLTVTSQQSLGLLIGKGGQTLDAIEMLVKQILLHKTRSYGKHIQVDAESYRALHAEHLHEVAADVVREALEAHDCIHLEPMSPRDRRIIHMAVLEIGGAETYSEGEEPHRYIVICPPGMAQKEND